MLKNSYVHESKLFSLLRGLNPKEIDEFSLWLTSPIHNTSTGVRQLYEALKKSKQGLNTPCTKFDILQYSGAIPVAAKHRNLSPKEEITVRQLMYKLNVQVQKYMAWKKSEEDEFESKRLFIQTLFDKKLYKLIPNELRKLEKKVMSSPIRDAPYHEIAFGLAELKFAFGILTGDRKNNAEAQKVIDTLRQSSLSKILKYYCSMINLENLRKVKYHYPFIDVVDEYMENNDDKNIPGIGVYYSLLKLLQEDNPKYYQDLKNYLFNNSELFSIQEIRQFLNHMTNYCTRSIQKGARNFTKEKQEIYELGLEIKCWSTNIYFSAPQFLSIITNALLLDKTIWAEQFVAEHKDTLNPSTQKDIINYGNALIAFHKKEFVQAQDFLTRIYASGDFAYQMQYRILLAKIYYELKNLNIGNVDTHPINYELEAIRQHVISTRNKRMSETRRQSYNNFVNIFKSILERQKKLIFKEKVSEKSMKKLKEKLQNISPIVEQAWLEEKIEELMRQII